LAHGVHPGNILALTFTNKAADEMKARVRRLAPGADVWIGTFHRFCARLLRRYANYVGLDTNFTIYDTSDSRQALKKALRRLDIAETMTTPERMASQISWLKNHLIVADDFHDRDTGEISSAVKKVYPAYQAELLAANAVDFDDLLLHTVTLLKQSPELRSHLDEAYQYVMVDEYQDTNLAQYAIVRGLSNVYPNLAVTGDPDQSIYGWRGANLSNILDFEKDYPKVRVVRLEQNYRSTPNVLRVAQALISNNLRRKPKDLFTDNPEGAPVVLATYNTHNQEAEDIVQEITRQIRDNGRRPRDFAIFYRVNALSRTFEHLLRSEGIPYQIVNGVEFYQRKEIKDLLAYLHLIYNPLDNAAFDRIINVPPRRIGKTTVERLTEYAAQQRVPMLQAARESAQVAGVAKIAQPRLRDFTRMIDRLSQQAHLSVAGLLNQLLDETGYLVELRASGTPEDDERAENVEELLTAAAEFDDANEDPDALGAFLDKASLVNDIDAWDEQTDRVTLMTLHAAKGLEFPCVYIVGVEHGLLPHERSLSNRDQEEEERRLLFVGITRAQLHLQLSYCRIRSRRGNLSHAIPSNFLMELPRNEMEIKDLCTGPAFRTFHDDDEFDAFDSGPEDDVEVIDVRSGERTPATSSEYSQLAATSEPNPMPQDGDENARVNPPPRSPAFGGSHLPLQTAADMLSPGARLAAPNTVDPDQFQVGMTVVHPTYGPGKIATLSGNGKDRTATINFAALPAPKSFILSRSAIRPARL
ncbi:MAG: UvrD-helicase domain-containing protein, partial [Planctomycetales bacterium]|nr:UvrD-helicase domain-containing protein [Planctomycetales bacterium]